MRPYIGCRSDKRKTNINSGIDYGTTCVRRIVGQGPASGLFYLGIAREIITAFSWNIADGLVT
jgi:hypothetical protein